MQFFEEKKVDKVLKNSGNSLSDGHRNFAFWAFGSWKNLVGSWKLEGQISKIVKNGNFQFLGGIYFGLDS